MGLDVTAYSNLTPIGQHTHDWCQEDDHVVAFAYSNFTASFRGLPVLRTDEQFIYGGCYAHTGTTETHKFQAGSYSGYNAWRGHLRAQFNPDTRPDQPFYELIWFADNEGCIGPDAARDLLADFREHAAAYRVPDDDVQGWYREKYEAWTRACDLAADCGLIRFC